MHPVPRAAFGLLTLVFGYAAFLQFNDPDPIMWVAVYGMAGGLCMLAATKHEAPPTFPFFVGAIALFWAGSIANVVYGGGSVTPMFPKQQMTGNLMYDTEEGREMGGLLIIVAAMAVLIVAQIYDRHGTTKRRMERR